MDKKFCVLCGTPLKEGEIECPKCGKKVKNVSNPQTISAPSQKRSADSENGEWKAADEKSSDAASTVQGLRHSRSQETSALQKTAASQKASTPSNQLHPRPRKKKNKNRGPILFAALVTTGVIIYIGSRRFGAADSPAVMTTASGRTASASQQGQGAGSTVGSGESMSLTEESLELLEGGWIQDNNTWKYRNADFEYLSSTWFQEGDKWYYFDEDGIMVTGHQIIDGKEQNFLLNGEWIDNLESQDMPKLETDQTMTPEAADSQTTADPTATETGLTTSSATLASEVTISETTSESETTNEPETTAAPQTTTAPQTTAEPPTTAAPTRPASGWHMDGDSWYYVNEDGAYVVSLWKYIDGYYYYFDGNGYMVRGWLQADGNWYFLDENGRMVTGEKTINGEVYYFETNGAMRENAGVQTSRILKKPFDYLESGEIDQAVKALKSDSCSALGKTVSGSEYVYYGDTNDYGMPDGYGIAAYTGSYYYYGHWDNGIRSGDGMWITGSGSGTHYYEGEWEDDTPTGNGAVINKSGNTTTTYEGYFQDGYGMGDFTVTQESGSTEHIWYFEAYLGTVDEVDAPVCEDCSKKFSLNKMIKVDGF